jgi:hypothetical protein
MPSFAATPGEAFRTQPTFNLGKNMGIPLEKPWAILLCRYSDDPTDPTTAPVSALAAQWPGHFKAEASSDNQTILQLYSLFFTSAGATKTNLVGYWRYMSHGTIDVSGTQVFPCQLDLTTAAALDLYNGFLSANAVTGGGDYQNAIFKKAKSALLSQHGVDWTTYYAVAVSFQSPDRGSQGGWYDGGPGLFMDARYVTNNGIARWGHEMGHGFGLDHSRTNNDGNLDYTDKWDIMSAELTWQYADPDQDFGPSGPGLNAWNMRGRQWLDETRVAKLPAINGVSGFVTLRPLHRHDLPGILSAELPGIGTDSAYLVEFREEALWDAGIPGSSIMVHRFEGPIGQFLGTHSYVMTGTNGQKALKAGDSFISENGPFSKMSVLSIDDANHSAVIQVWYASMPRTRPEFKPIPWWEWDPELTQNILNNSTKDELRGVEMRAESLLENIRRLIALKD